MITCKKFDKEISFNKGMCLNEREVPLLETGSMVEGGVFLKCGNAFLEIWVLLL